MKTITSVIITMCALASALRAERESSVFDHAFSEIKAAEDQAALLKKLG